MNVATLATIVGVAGALTGGAYFLEDRYASHAEVRAVELQVSAVSKEFRVFALEQRYAAVRSRFWRLQDRTGCRGAARAECRQLREEMLKIRERIKRTDRRR